MPVIQEQHFSEARLGIDIGGTFTDAALEVGGRRFTAKELTTHAAPDDGVITVMERVIAEAGLSIADLDLMIHGTTLATNAIIERKGARTAMLTTFGVRDAVQTGPEHRFDLYDLFIDLPTPLVPRRLRLPITERMSARGDVLEPLREHDVLQAVETLERERIEAVAVCFLHSYRNPAHEQRVGEMLARAMPGASVSLSSEVAPEMREYERFSTACANAYVQPMMARYLGRLEKRLRAKGMRCPLLLMLSGGGLTTIETATRFPVRLVESGPAGGVVFSASLAAEHGLSNVISFDMGGTTAKICLIDGGRPQTSRTFEVARVYRFKKGSGLPLRIPVIDMVEIGAGGGSIAHLDSLSRVLVGPESAGSEPGPACYARGGTSPAVTDCDLALGRIHPQGFAGGRFPLDVSAASAAISAGVGQTLDMSVQEAAVAVASVVEDNMAAAARVHAIESGKAVRDRTLIAFGGAAPLHVAGVAKKLGVSRFLVPPSAGVGSAVGFLRAPVSYEVARSRQERLSALDINEVNAFLDEMSAVANAVVRPASGDRPVRERRTASMRYLGQGHEITVETPSGPLTETDRATLERLFTERYVALYGRALKAGEIELLAWSTLVSTESAPVNRQTLPASAPYVPEPHERRQVYDADRFEPLSYAIHRRADLRPGAAFAGPAIIEEDETSTLIPLGSTVCILSTNAILCTLGDERAVPDERG